MKKFIYIGLIAILLMLTGGCFMTSMMSNAIVPRPNVNKTQKELDYHTGINTSILANYSSLSEGVDAKHIPKILKAIDRESSRAHNAGEIDKLALGVNQIIGNTTRPMVEDALNEGMSWTKETIGTIAGGGGGGIGLLVWQMLRGRKRQKQGEEELKREKKKTEIYKEVVVKKGALGEAKEAAKYTEVEREV